MTSWYGHTFRITVFVRVDSSHKGPVKRSFDTLFVIRLSMNKLLNKPLKCLCFETPWLSCVLGGAVHLTRHQIQSYRNIWTPNVANWAFNKSCGEQDPLKPRPRLSRETVFSGIGIPVIKARRSWECLNFIIYAGRATYSYGDSWSPVSEWMRQLFTSCSCNGLSKLTYFQLGRLEQTSMRFEANCQMCLLNACDHVVCKISTSLFRPRSWIWPQLILWFYIVLLPGITLTYMILTFFVIFTNCLNVACMGTYRTLNDNPKSDKCMQFTE